MSERTIAEVAEEFGITHRTLRFYEQKGLLTPRRGTGPVARRFYSAEDVDRLSQIRAWVALGLELEEIRQLLKLRDDTPRRTYLKAAREIAERRLVEARKQREAIGRRIPALEEWLTRMDDEHFSGASA